MEHGSASNRDGKGTILIIDDSAATRSQVRAALEAAHCLEEVLEAEDGLAGFKVALARRPDLIVCDLVMPRFDGFKLLTLCASHPELSKVPIILLTADGDSDRKVDLFHKGASDYVTKPFHEKELVARVRVHLRLKLAQDELRELSAKFEALSNRDPLTGLYNRRHMDRTLSSELARASRYKKPVSVVMIDLDHFKRINDEHGHAMGDEVIKNLGKVATANVRDVDVVTRYGGEEVVVILPETDALGAALVAERLRAAFAATEHVLDGARVRATASLGVASYDGLRQPFDPRSLVSRADHALYRAKAGGRNRVVAWTPATSEPCHAPAHGNHAAATPGV